MRTLLVRWLVSTCVLTAIVFLHGCTSSPNKAAPGAPATQSNPAFKLYTIEIKEMKFVPDEVRVHKGDTVMFVNKDIVAHDVTEVPNTAYTSSPLQPQDSWRLVVTYSSDYYCSIHKVMKGKIVME